MRRFHSYGPVDCEEYFCVPRTALVEQCVQHLVGGTEKSGHYFTIWAPRQTGKTWLIRQARDEIERRFPNQFTVGTMSMQGLTIEPDDPDEVFFDFVPSLFRAGLSMDVPAPRSWEEWQGFFSRHNGLFSRPALLFIDEFDSLPPEIIDRLVTLFRDIYLKRESYHLHGLALIGLRALLGGETSDAIPFNIQRSLHVPNLTREETAVLFRQYRQESGQDVAHEVADAVHDAACGHPGLVSWFGELLTEKYNPGPEKGIRMPDWETVYSRALLSEPNDMVANLVQKVRAGHLEHVLRLFAQSKMPFELIADWCVYLHWNGVIDSETVGKESGQRETVCRFSSPFVQARLFHALTTDVIGDHLPLLPLDSREELPDVIPDSELGVPALLEMYKAYLARLKAEGKGPWKGKPLQPDLRLNEAVGFLHLFLWLKEALEDRCEVNPDFPTRSGRVVLDLRCKEQRGLIEVKRFRSRLQLADTKTQAAGSAARMGFPAVTIALFIAVADETVLATLSGEEEMDGVRVTTVAIGWG